MKPTLTVSLGLVNMLWLYRTLLLVRHLMRTLNLKMYPITTCVEKYTSLLKVCPIKECQKKWRCALICACSEISRRNLWKYHNGSFFVESESRVVGQIRSTTNAVVESMNELLKQGLGEVEAKYDVALLDICSECNVKRRGQKLPTGHLASLGFRKLQGDHFRVPRPCPEARFQHFPRHPSVFLGSFSFPGVAGDCLPNLLMSIIMAGLLRPWLFLLCGRQSCEQ